MDGAALHDTAAVSPQHCRSLVLVAFGADHDPAGPALLLPEVAERLAMLLGVASRALHDQGSPDQALAGLGSGGSAPVAWLPRDPGLIMADGGCWAEALAAWRQPTLLVVSPLQLGTGFPAACTALLQRCSVPLLGLIQWGDGWRESERRADRLPWLGSLSNRASVEAEDREDEDRLITLLRWRWQRLDVQGGA